jgi:ADP-L-glycero-D-manno-heptose 6-epimerase
MMEWNYDFSKVLLHTAIEDRASFIYASSAAVYGDGGQGFREELACEWPLNVYGFSKYAFDNYVRRLAPTPASNVVGLRYFNVYGPQETHKKNMSSVIYHFFQSYCAGQPLSLFEGSDQFLRDFVYVDDVVEVNLFCLRQRVSGTFNCGTGQARSFFDLASLVAARLGNTAIQQVPFPLDLAGKYQKYTQADISRLRRAGYGGDFTSLEEGVAKYLECLTARGGYLER